MTPHGGTRATRYATTVPVTHGGVIVRPIIWVPFIFDCVWN